MLLPSAFIGMGRQGGNAELRASCGPNLFPAQDNADGPGRSSLVREVKRAGKNVAAS